MNLYYYGFETKNHIFISSKKDQMPTLKRKFNVEYYIYCF